MGDLIEKLPVDDTLDYSQQDVTNLKRFFDTSISTKKEKSKKSDKNVYMFVGLITLLFFICSHPSGPGRFFPDQYKLTGTSLIFAISIFLYLYFNK